MNVVHLSENRPLSGTFQTKWALVVLALGASALSARGAPLTIWNGVEGDGSLTVTTDDFGSFGDWLFGPEVFDPSPDPDQGDVPAAVTFATFLYVSVDPSAVGNGTHHGVLTTHPGLSAYYDDGNLVGIVTVPNTLIDFQTCASEFNVIGPGIRVSFTLTQRVSTAPNGPDGERVAKLEQMYTMVNARPEALNFVVTKHVDQEMPWDPGQPYHLDDRVGMDLSELDRPQVYSQAYFQGAESTTVVMMLRTREDMTENPMTTTHPQTGASNSVYYVGKQKLAVPPGNPDFPGGQCPEHDYGTVFQIWDNYGLPNCWKNFVPGVGYDVPGMSPGVSGDAFIGLQTEAALTDGNTYEMTFVTVYGRRPGMVFGDGDLDGDIDLDDFGLFLACFSGAGTPHAPEEACARFDPDADGDVDFQDFCRFQRAFVSGQ